MLSGEKNMEKREGILEREIEPKPGNVGGECQRHTPPLTTFDCGESRKSHNGTQSLRVSHGNMRYPDINESPVYSLDL